MAETSNPRKGLTRRGFLKTTGAAAGIAVAGGVGFSGLGVLDKASADSAAQGDEVFYGVCRSNCMQSCRYAAHVRDGKLVKLEPADYDQDYYRGSCLRGISYNHRIYNPNRIMYPMRRVGERGAGEWERISWDDAIAEIAERFQKIIDEYGPTAIAFDFGTGNYGEVHGQTGIFNRLGGVMGVTKPVGQNDLSTGYGIDRVIGTGLMYFANEASSVLDSSHIFIWGSNPVHSTPQNWRWMWKAHEQGTKIITIDPVRTATAHKSDEYFSITATTDGYLALAMANYVIENGLQDDEFLKNRSTGAFLVRNDTGLLLRKSDFATLAEGEKDQYYVWDEAAGHAALLEDAAQPAMEGSFVHEGIEVTTSYSLLKEQLSSYTVSEAAKVCGMKEEDIEYLAKELAGAGAASVNISFGLDHYTNGYQSCWAIAILMALTGNLGKPGAGFTGIYLNNNVSLAMASLWAGKGYKGMKSPFPMSSLHEVVEAQEYKGQPYPMKAMLSITSNSMSNWPGQNNYIEKIVGGMDFLLAMDMEMTDTCRYADIVLPIASFYEGEDFRKAHNLPYMVYNEKAIDPLYEAKNDWEIAALIGRALGYAEAFPEDWTFDNYANLLLKGKGSTAPENALERLREEKFLNVSPHPEYPVVIGEEKFPTESGRAQLYTEKPAPRSKVGQEGVAERTKKEHLVYYQEAQEAGPNSELAEKYPLVFIQEHSRWRTHSQWFDVAMLKELEPKPVFKISEQDAQQRGIASGDTVEVFNDRGKMVVDCLVDPSLPQGMCRMPKGWQREAFAEGGYQELTNPNIDDWAVAFCFYDTRVDVRKK